MKEKLGFIAFTLGLVTFTGVAGAVTDFPLDATIAQWVTLFGISFVAGCLMQTGVWMIKDEI